MTITSSSTDLTLNGPDISTKLSLSGGAMTGTLDMNARSITGASNISSLVYIILFKMSFHTVFRCQTFQC